MEKDDEFIWRTTGMHGKMRVGRLAETTTRGHAVPRCEESTSIVPAAAGGQSVHATSPPPGGLQEDENCKGSLTMNPPSLNL
ncbi:MAG TPA: hypothetical protein VFK10_19755, partial [Burkholderiaceae bacterium]|nr:hypothetical protein [Burkholderiaceae bacterium]